MRYQRIGLDMDGVLYNWERAVRNLVMERTGQEVPLSTSWDFLKQTIGPETWRWVWKPEQVVRMFSEGRAYPGAVAGALALRGLADQLYILTSGPFVSTSAKVGWLEKVGIRYNRFVRLEMGTPKTVVPCDLYVDDGPHVAEQVVRARFDTRLILVDRTYNREVEDHPRITRARGWAEVVRSAQKREAA